MTKLTNIRKIWNAPLGVAVVVGNNRTISRVGSDLFECRLHGHCVVTVELSDQFEARLKFNSCGFTTNTSRAAMNDFIKVFSINGSISFAGGNMTFRHSAQTYNTAAPKTTAISLTAHRELQKETS